MSLVKSKTTSTEGLSETNVQKLTDSLAQYIVRPSSLFGISGFIFDVEGETRIQHTSNITDNYVESNAAVQDHVAVAPTKLNLTRYVGELVDTIEDDPRSEIAQLVAKLAPIVAFAPQLTQAASFVKGAINGETSFNEQTLSEADNLYALFQNLNPNASKKQRAYLYFKALQEKSIPISVQTPFSYFQNMAIESLIATEDEDTRDIATFSLVLKELRFASIETVNFDPKKFQNRSKSQQAPLAKNGRASGKQGLRSTAFNIFKGN